MGRARAGSRATKGGKKKKKALPSDEVLAEYAAAAELAAQQNEEYIERSTKDVAAKLNEEETAPTLSRAVRYAGMDLVTEVLQQTEEMEASGGMMTADGTRRCTKGGVFLKLLKMWLNPEQFMLIYQQAYDPAKWTPELSASISPPITAVASGSLGAPSLPISMSSGSRDRGSMLGGGSDLSTDLSTSLGASPPMNLLSTSMGSSLSGSFNPDAKAFIPGSLRSAAAPTIVGTNQDPVAAGEKEAQSTPQLDMVDDETFVME